MNDVLSALIPPAVVAAVVIIGVVEADAFRSGGSSAGARASEKSSGAASD